METGLELDLSLSFTMNRCWCFRERLCYRMLNNVLEAMFYIGETTAIVEETGTKTNQFLGIA